MHEAVPYNTDDAIEAFCLYIAGVPEFRPPTNTYDEAKLRKLGYRGLTLLDAVQAAWKRGDRGRVQYWFERSPELPHLTAAYRDQVAKIDSPGESQDGGEHLRSIMSKATNPGPAQMDEREALLRVACVVLKGRIQFVNRWKEVVPLLMVGGTGAIENLGDNTTRHPGFKLVPLNLPQSQLQKLGL